MSEQRRLWRFAFRCGACSATAATLIVFLACRAGDPPAAPSGSDSSAPGLPPPRVADFAGILVGAGDIARCGEFLPNALATSRLLDAIEGVVFTAGDNAYNSGTEEEFVNCFEPTWGRHKARIHPSPGNHDYRSAGAAPYFQYFGPAAGPPGTGFYSYDIRSWHVISLNSNVSMQPGSPQANWLRQDLEAHPTRCTAAYWHHPLVSSGPHGGTETVRDAWRILYDFGADVVINGHDHLYERFVPQDPFGQADPSRGIRQFTVGTGGDNLYTVTHTERNSEISGSAHGVLKLTLGPHGYDWNFIPVPGSNFSDSGSGSCH